LVNGRVNQTDQLFDPYKDSPGNSIHVVNYTSSPPGQIIAFTIGRAPTVIDYQNENFPFWTPAIDTIELQFEDEYSIDVYFWIIMGPFDQQKKRALHAYNRTSYIWFKERLGIHFNGFNVTDNTKDTDDVIVRLRSQADPKSPMYDSNFAFLCADVEDLANQNRAKPNKINIYYVGRVKSSSEQNVSGAEYGTWCPGSSKLPGNFILMGDNTSPDLLAHELGHALVLEHIDLFSDTVQPPQSYFNDKNVMHSASVIRKFLTEGQTFRAVVNQDSALNLPGLYNARQGLIKRSCGNFVIPGPKDDSQACPPIHTRIWDDR